MLTDQIATDNCDKQPVRNNWRILLVCFAAGVAASAIVSYIDAFGVFGVGGRRGEPGFRRPILVFEFQMMLLVPAACITAILFTLAHLVTMRMRRGQFNVAHLAAAAVVGFLIPVIQYVGRSLYPNAPGVAGIAVIAVLPCLAGGIVGWSQKRRT